MGGGVDAPPPLLDEVLVEEVPPEGVLVGEVLADVGEDNANRIYSNIVNHN
tara:strand:+ start:2141 stop:2293 length:153 start_codon:yes stop_codon:yes gene_type:complete